MLLIKLSMINYPQVIGRGLESGRCGLTKVALLSLDRLCYMQDDWVCTVFCTCVMIRLQIIEDNYKICVVHVIVFKLKYTSDDKN